MKQKTYVRMIIISILAILATMVGITFVYYGLFLEQIRADLRVEARLLSDAGINGLIGNQAIIEEEEIRITWISQDGKVLFDNDVDADNLGNHMDRPEVQEAFAYGHGESARKSDTMKLQTYYYALLLEDGTVIRVSKEARSFINIFLSTFPVVMVIVGLIIILCIVISHFLTIQLLKPIQRMAENIDYIPDQSCYKELSPFIDRIREQHEDILAYAKARQDFTANVSHELKTPITAISGYAELIENKMVNEDQQIKFAGDIRKNADRLVTLVNDIIRLSEMDQLSKAPDFTRLDLYEIAKERVELLSHNARERAVKLILKGQSCEITANRGMMVELFDNLIQNAIRYNVENGEVTINISKNGNTGILVVSDTGIGIPKIDQERVFERFYRVDRSRSRETGGTGLGLAIVKHIVELHDGKIALESILGLGTTIRVEI